MELDCGSTVRRHERGFARYALARRRMVERLAHDGLRDARVLRALRAVPRDLLVPEALQGRAYREDEALPIGEGQTISAPRTVAAMTAALRLRGPETVLEIGTGSAYQAAVLSKLCARVVSVERVPALAARAREALAGLGISNVTIHEGDGSCGRPSEAPFDAIVVTAGGPRIPVDLLQQLAPGGRLVGPFGARDGQWLVRIRRAETGLFEREILGACRFVDLVGVGGWAA
jgi:protein-L-isoaspartate(D-aspartate) O-methyltransferase